MCAGLDIARKLLAYTIHHETGLMTNLKKLGSAEPNSGHVPALLNVSQTQFFAVISANQTPQTHDEKAQK